MTSSDLYVFTLWKKAKKTHTLRSFKITLEEVWADALASGLDDVLREPSGPPVDFVLAPINTDNLPNDFNVVRVQEGNRKTLKLYCTKVVESLVEECYDSKMRVDVTVSKKPLYDAFRASEARFNDKQNEGWDPTKSAAAEKSLAAGVDDAEDTDDEIAKFPVAKLRHRPTTAPPKSITKVPTSDRDVANQRNRQKPSDESAKPPPNLLTMSCPSTTWRGTLVATDCSIAAKAT
ncbi:hypothetical protein L914_14181 [Phytophthora nicotianae]|uniref:Uncharacterized protein n=2 Tax=Phytophthora nicotianae TaxID=4792 RepID=V9EKC5_PHYNI|nr:hypothetical protein F443_14743 [Phytophthora nicotianae P1569]ETM39677.1 hypothetical protein L914_14181 [Phytophthora nicotianae]